MQQTKRDQLHITSRSWQGRVERMREPLRGFFSSMAVCWLCCLVTVALFSLLDFVSSNKSQPHLLYQRPLYLKVIRLQSYREIAVSQDVHDVFVAVISCSYELWTHFLREVLIISLTYEFFPMVSAVITKVVPNWIFQKVTTTIIEPYQKWNEKPMPGNFHLTFYHSMHTYIHAFIMLSRSSIKYISYHRIRECRAFIF